MLLCSCFAFLCSCVNERMCRGWGCMDGSGVQGQFATAPLPRFEVTPVSHPQSPPSTSPLGTHHNCVISSQEHEFSVPILSRSVFLSSCIKFSFPRARVTKIPVTRVCQTRNVSPSLVFNASKKGVLEIIFAQKFFNF